MKLRSNARICGPFALFISLLCLAAVLACPAMAYGVGLPLQSTAQFQKSEVIYADLAADGQVEDAFVVNQFEIAKPGLVVDFGKYSQVRNLTDQQQLRQDGSSVVFEAEPGAFYYQGNLGAAKLPWDVQVSYYLNGEEQYPQDMGGATGDVEIRLTTRDNGSALPIYAKSFMMQVTLTLDADVCFDIQAEGATVASSGGSRTVAFTALPGHDGDFTCNFQAENFHMDAITLAALPYSMDMDMPDTGALADGMSQLADAVSQLAEGSHDLAQGAADFAAGLRKMSDGMGDFGDGLNAIDESSGQLLDGSAQINEALSKIGESLEGVDLSFLDDIDFSALTELQESGNWPELTDEQIDQIVSLMEELPALKEALEMLKSLDVPELSRELVSLADSLDALAQQLDDFDASWIESLSQVRQAIASLPEPSVSADEIEALRAAVADDEAAVATLEQLLASYDAMVSLQDIFQQTDGDLQALEEFLQQLSETSETLPGELSDASSALRILSAALIALDESGLLEKLEDIDIPDDLDPAEVRELLEQAAVVLDELEDFDFTQLAQLSLLVDGLVQLSDQYGDFHDGLGKYFDGVSQLAENYGTMSDGEKELADGADSLSSGLGQYNDGMQTFNAEISSLPDTMQEQIDSMTSEYSFPSFDGTSFADLRNTSPVAVQFVLQTAAIDAPEEPVASDDGDGDLTFFDRFLALFK